MRLQSGSERVKEKINGHLRNMARQLITFDTLEETLNYLLESFYREYTCDLVGVILYDHGRLVPKAWRGDNFTIDKTLNLDINYCASNLLEDALWWQKDQQKDIRCDFHTALKNESLSTWFTVPLKNNNKSFGLCVIGFRDFFPLVLEADKIFAEFGHDVATALDLARNKEKQKRKMKGIEWIKENIFPGSSIEQVIEKVVERAGKGTQAIGACVYLYDEGNQCFVINPPWYGSVNNPIKININTNKTVDCYFPFVETPGGSELTVPLIVNLKTIGMLYVTTDGDCIFNEDDLDFLKFVSDFVSMQIENARLYKYEYESKKKLEKILEHQQELVRKTVEGVDLSTITKTISSMVESSVLLYDRFLNPLTSNFKAEESHLEQSFEKLIQKKKNQITSKKSHELWIEENHLAFSVWRIVGGREVLGYLVICIARNKMDRIFRLTWDYVLNVYAIEFIKQKLVLDAQEQVKESFVNQLFSEKIDDQEKIIQYATLTNWNVLESHRVAVLSIEIDEEKEKNLVIVEEIKSLLWDQIKSHLALHYMNIIFSRKGDEYILIVRLVDEQNSRSDFWKQLFQRMIEVMKKERPISKLYLGIGGNTEKIEDYYYGYVKAEKAKNVVTHRFRNGGYAFYDDLGSYTILNNTSDQLAAEMFVKKKLSPLIQYSEKNNADLFTTLKVFLLHNGNLREASAELFIHRSTLEYRLERVAELLNMDLNNADIRFELMMAYKLYSLFDFKPAQLL